MVFGRDPIGSGTDIAPEKHAGTHVKGGQDELTISLSMLPRGAVNTVLIGNGLTSDPSYSAAPTLTALVVLNVLAVGDGNFTFALSSGNPRITLEGTDTYLEYIRASNIWRFAVGGVTFLEIDAAGQLQLKVTGSAGGLSIGGDTNIYRHAADVLRTPDKFIFDGEIEVDGAFNHDGTLFGVYGKAPVAQGTGGENVTNSVTNSGSTDGTIPDITDGTTYANDYVNLRRALYQLARLLKQDHDQLRANGYLT